MVSNEKTKSARHDLYITTFERGLIAGILIAIGALAKLSASSAAVGSILFSFGLLTICVRGYMLITGMIGYVFRKIYVPLQYIAALLGNVFGVIIVAILSMGLSNYPAIHDAAAAITEAKLAMHIEDLLASGTICGFLVYIGVDSFRTDKKSIIHTVVLILAVTIFVLIGADHCIADIFYFIVGEGSFGPSILSFICVLIGNICGASLTGLLKEEYS